MSSIRYQTRRTTRTRATSAPCRAACRRRRPPKTYDDERCARRPWRASSTTMSTSTFASTLSDYASETTEEHPYHYSRRRRRNGPPALPENGVLPPALLPSVLCDGGEAAPRAPAAPLINNFVYTVGVPRHALPVVFRIVAVPGCCCARFLVSLSVTVLDEWAAPLPRAGGRPASVFGLAHRAALPLCPRASFLECEALQGGDEEGSGSTGYLCSTLLLYRPKCTSRRLGMERQLVFALRMHGRTAAAIGACGLSP